MFERKNTMPPVHPEIVNGHQFLMMPVEAGTFLMGSPDDDAEAYSWEKPRHSVQISAFHLGRFPVTQALWRAVVQAENPNDSGPSLDPEPSFFTGDQRPVEQVSWDDVQVFLRKLNDLTKASRPKEHAYRLPTDAEWEYAARGGNKSQGYKYAGSNKLQEVGWFSDNSHSETKPVGLNDPNELGIYDMTGNLWEWCEDVWHDNYNDAPN